jgi:hypothetical protein
LLCDTALTDLGGLHALALHLLDPSTPAGVPRTAATADAKLIDALVGRYRLQIGLGMELRRKDDALTIQADGQPEFAMGYDSAGDFYPLQFDALLRPKRKADGIYTFTWFQLGGVVEAERISAPPPLASKWTPAEGQLKEYEGSYPLAPTFALASSPRATSSSCRAPISSRLKSRPLRRTYSSPFLSAPRSPSPAMPPAKWSR